MTPPPSVRGGELESTHSRRYTVRGALYSALLPRIGITMSSKMMSRRGCRGGGAGTGGGRKKQIILVMETQWTENPVHQIEECYAS